jgi:hypothetical protein
LSRYKDCNPDSHRRNERTTITQHNNMLLLWNYYKSSMCKEVEISNTRDACLRLFLRASCVFHSTAQLANGHLGKTILGSISIPDGMGLQSLYLDNSNLLRYNSNALKHLLSYKKSLKIPNAWVIRILIT